MISSPANPKTQLSATPAVSRYRLYSPGVVAAFAIKRFQGSTEIQRTIVGFSRNSNPVEAWYFPGRSSRRALIVGGMHGSELSSIEVAKTLIAELRNGEKPFYSLIVIPCLFPDNAQLAISNPVMIGSVNNIGRYSSEQAVDPNRQMPSAGKPFDSEGNLDHLGRSIEAENTMLLAIIQDFQPERMISIHAIRDKKYAGIFADPRTNSKGYALGFESDSSLVIAMARHIENSGGDVFGNTLATLPMAKYYCDPAIAVKGEWQARNLKGSSLPANRGKGTSMGTWASTAIEEGIATREAITTITIEFPGYKREKDYIKPADREACRKNINSYTASIRNIFLEQN